MKPKVQLLLRAPGQAATWEGEDRTACPAGGSALCRCWNSTKKVASKNV